jgi:hypothetical protein
MGEQSMPEMTATRPTTVSEKLPSNQAHVPPSKETAFTVIGKTEISLPAFQSW